MTFDLKKRFKEIAEAEALKKRLSLVKRLQAETPVDTGHARESWTSTPTEISNSAPYISSLNNGHSKQAPSNFIEGVVVSDTVVVPNGTIVVNR